MRATEEFIKARFEYFNNKMFGGRLPEIPIELSSAKTFLGQCVSNVHNLPDGYKRHSNFRLRISTRHDIPETLLEDTIIHEMIHYFIALNGLTDTSPHGEIFKAIMRSVNINFKRNITISHRGDNSNATAADVQANKKWHIVAAIYLKSGKVGFKVLPHTKASIAKFHTAINRVPEIKEVRIYASTNPVFGQYPSSAALKIHLIDADFLKANLTDAQRIH